MTFPIAKPGNIAQDFFVTIASFDTIAKISRDARNNDNNAILQLLNKSEKIIKWHAISTEPSTSGLLPVSPAVEHYDIFIPQDSHRSQYLLMRVKYKQTGKHIFKYILSSGAYWHGSINYLRVEIYDTQYKLAHAKVENQFAHHRQGPKMFWQFENLEPQHDVIMELK
ncbi:MAG: hypothetical protein JW841_03610 [Deltaproteobacteria bacterium]|nr:hypothetical protein [Deltaproteobacteria bacterium]